MINHPADGRIKPDNSLTENAIRPTAVSRKNRLFIGDAAAGETTATLYTIIESARRQGLDPEACLTSPLTRLPALRQSGLPGLHFRRLGQSPQNPRRLSQINLQDA